MTTLPVRAVLLLLACLIVAGCHPLPPSLVGTYSVDNKGQRVEFLCVEQKDGKFLSTEKKRDAWGSPVEVKPLDKASLNKLFAGKETADMVALGTNQAALCKVPKGWKAGNFECKTGYACPCRSSVLSSCTRTASSVQQSLGASPSPS